MNVLCILLGGLGIDLSSSVRKQNILFCAQLSMAENHACCIYKDF
jgi:hypothetical protein